MDRWGFLTKALMLKPKKLTSGWEHKKGFYVGIDAKSAFTAIDGNRENYSISKKSDFYNQLELDSLRDMAEMRLYKIQSSSNNYIEIICSFGGFGVLVYLWDLFPEIWTNPEQNTVRIFLVLLVILAMLIFLYFKKKQIDKYDIEVFLAIEDALYKHEYGDSQYTN